MQTISLPVYDVEENDEKKREVRGIPIFPIIKEGLKLLATSAVIVGSTIAVNKIQKLMDEAEREEWKPLKRETLDCKLNNYGCVYRLCWVNCGPRLKSGDYCYATSGKINDNIILNTTQLNTTVYNNHSGSFHHNPQNSSISYFIPFAKCSTDYDCDPCNECASTCIYESGASLF